MRPEAVRSEALRPMTTRPVNGLRNSSRGEISLTRSRAYTLLETMLVLTLVGILTSIAVPMYTQLIENGERSTAETDIRQIEDKILQYMLEYGRYPDSLAVIGMDIEDPWGNPYQYLNIANAGNGKVKKNGKEGKGGGNGKVRKDKNLVPINSDFDLYSMGEDGKSVSPLTAKHSRDDIVRAGNGSFVGLAVDF